MIPVLIYNTIVVICFCVLAYLFQHWWIALFACLLILTYKRQDNDKKEGREDDAE